MLKDKNFWFFGEMELPKEGQTRDEAYEESFRIACACGYMSEKVGGDMLLISGEEGEYLVTYDRYKPQILAVHRLMVKYRKGL